MLLCWLDAPEKSPPCAETGYIGTELWDLGPVDMDIGHPCS